MTDNDFSSWFPWTSRNKIMGVKNPGIYILAISGKDLSNQPFSWREEIIYIGMTNSSAGLKGRLQQFDNTINGKTGHGGADRVRFKYEGYEELSKRLFVSVMPVFCNVKSNHPDDLLKMGDVAKLEYVCFAEYASKFGHLPQFNDKKNSPKFSLTKGRQRK